MLTNRPRLTSARQWLHAIRPKTLTIAIVPVIVGTALGYVDTGRVGVALGLTALAVAVLIQAGTNLHNDAADFERGADDSKIRLGPPRATAEGWFSAREVRMTAALCFIAATGFGCYLIVRGGWPVVAIGVACIVAAVAYSAGPRPIAYTSLGEVLVLLFFGLVAVTGSYYVQTSAITLVSVMTGVVVGMPAAAVLVVNNYRDLEADRRVGRRTVAVRWGREVSRWEYGALIFGALALAPFVQMSVGDARWSLLTWLLVPWGWRLIRRFWHEPPGPAFNGILTSTARFQVVLGFLLCIGLVLESSTG